MEALPLRAGRANCMSNIQQDMIEQTLAILASMMQQAAHDATLYCAEAKRTVIMEQSTSQNRGLLEQSLTQS
jgi:histone H3/H4